LSLRFFFFAYYSNSNLVWFIYLFFFFGFYFDIIFYCNYLFYTFCFKTFNFSFFYLSFYLSVFFFRKRFGFRSISNSICTFMYFSNFFLFFFEIGESLTDPNDQQIVMDWYNSLKSKGNLNWDGINDLCQEVGTPLILCDSSNRITYLYSFFLCFLFSFSSLFFIFLLFLFFFIQ